MILEIRGAEGGEEANLFARDLHEMYLALAAVHGWSVEPMGARESDMGGFSEVAVLVSGEDAWTRLKYEGGVHRVQRVPVTESQGRIHTSSATVSVLPEADEVEVEALIDDAASSSRIDTPLWDSLERAITRPFPTARLNPQFIVGFTDSRIYREKGSVAYGAGLMSPAVDTGEFSRRFHGHDERIDVESLRLTTGMYLDVCEDLLG